MTVTINEALQNQQVDAWGTDLNSGFIDIYSGPQPAANVAPTGTLLVSCTLAVDAYDPAVSGSAETTTSPSGIGVANGTAGYAQQRNAAGTRWQYGSVSEIGMGGDVELDTLTIAIGGTVTINVSTISQPSS